MATNKEKYFEAGHKLPKCINEGCNNDVAVREWKYFSFKSECSRCMNARKKGVEITKVNIHKKRYCENSDGHLGFKCPVPEEEWHNYLMALDLDHLDGDHLNNDPGNVKTYCKLCHMRKGARDGDHNSQKKSGRNLKKFLGDKD